MSICNKEESRHEPIGCPKCGNFRLDAYCYECDSVIVSGKAKSLTLEKGRNAATTKAPKAMEVWEKLVGCNLVKDAISEISTDTQKQINIKELMYSAFCRGVLLERENCIPISAQQS